MNLRLWGRLVRREALGLGLALGAALAVGSVALAQEPDESGATQTATAAGRMGARGFVPEGFVPVEGRPVDPIDANPLVVGSYAAVLAGLFAYLVHMVRGQAEIGRRIEELRRRLNDLDR